MKLIVKNAFRDKEDHVTVYEPGTILEVKDNERAADLVKRGLCAEYKGKKAATVTLGEESPFEKPEETPAADGAEAPFEKPEETPAADGAEAPADGGEAAKPKGNKK